MYSRAYQLIKEYLLPGANEIRLHTRELKDIEWIGNSELEEIQLEKIKQLVTYAYENVPYYHWRYQLEGIHPSDIKNKTDFQQLPFLTRDDINKHKEALLSKSYQGTTYKGITAGSTGNPMPFVLDKTTLSDSWAMENRCRYWYRVIPGAKKAWFWGYPQDYADWNWWNHLVSLVRRCRYFNSRTMTEDKMRDFAELLIKYNPTMFKAYPSALYLFARYIKEHNIENINPRLIETTAEKVTLSQRKLFEDVFRARVADCYSSKELEILAYECPEGSLHVVEDRYLELVENDRVVNPGQLGEVVVTSLNQYAMPFIRYKNGDMGIYRSDFCTCGRSMPVLDEIVGRSCDLLVNTDGEIVHWSCPDLYFDYYPEIYRYQIYQPDKEHIEVRLVCSKTLRPDFLPEIHEKLRLCFNENMNISINVVDDIELTPMGKHRFIISEVDQDALKQ